MPKAHAEHAQKIIKAITPWTKLVRKKKGTPADTMNDERLH